MLSGAFSPVHILVVLTVALVVLGPKELPKVVRSGARALRELRALRARLDEELHSLIDDDEPEGPPSYDDPDPAPPDPAGNGTAAEPPGWQSPAAAGGNGSGAETHDPQPQPPVGP